jgi:hypothetical protein
MPIDSMPIVSNTLNMSNMDARSVVEVAVSLSHVVMTSF